MQRGVEQLAGIITGKGTPGSIGTMHTGGQSDDAQPGRIVTKGWYR